MDFNSAKIENSNKSLNNLTYLDLNRFEQFKKPPNIDYTMASVNFNITKAPSFTASKIVNDGKNNAYSGIPVTYVESSQVKNSFSKEFKKIR
jgi:hypothetical protein